MILSDSFADVEKKTCPNGLQGNLGQLYNSKVKHGYKTILSVGGGANSTNFAPVCSDPRLRRNLVTSAVKMISDFGMDGIDIDWEHPSNPVEGQMFLHLLSELRSELDICATQKGTSPYLLSAALTCGAWAYQNLPLSDIGRVLDHIYLMAYDLSGEWTDRALHQACLFASEEEGCIDRAVVDFINAGIASHKIILGIPLYARGFGGTDGLGCKYDHVEGADEGTWRYRDLPLSGHTEFVDDQACTSGSQDANARVWTTYDTPASLEFKADYVREKGLGGMFFWELSGDIAIDDARYDERSLVVAAHRFLGIESGSAQLDTSPNHRY